MAIRSDINSFPLSGMPVLADVEDNICLGTLYKSPLRPSGFTIDSVGPSRLAGALTIAGALTGAAAGTFSGTVTAGALALGTGNITTTGDISTIITRAGKGWFTNLDIKNAPSINGTLMPTAEDLATKVGYIGAIKDLDLGLHNLITTGVSLSSMTLNGVGATFTRTVGDLSANEAGITTDTEYTPPNDESTYSAFGSQSLVQKYGNYKNTASIGLRGAQVQAVNRGTGAVTGIAGGTFYVANVNTGVITSGYGNYIFSPGVTVDHTINTVYGQYIAPQKIVGISANGYGIYQEGASDLNYFAGMLGIGTVPSYGLDVAAGYTSYFRGKVGIGQAPNASYYLAVTGASYFTGALTVTTNLGVGVAAAAGTPLFVQDDDVVTYDSTNIANSQGTFYNNNASGYSSIRLQTLASGGSLQKQGVIGVIDGDGANSRNSTMVFGLRDTATTLINEKMRLTYEGRLGISTLAPAYTLDVGGITRLTSDLYLTRDWVTGPYIGTLGSFPLRLGTNSTTVINILASGDVGINTTLAVTDTATMGGGVRASGYTATGWAGTGAEVGCSAGVAMFTGYDRTGAVFTPTYVRGSDVSIQSSTNKVGINTTAPSGILSICDGANGQQVFHSSSTELLTIGTGASTNTTITIPANVCVLAIDVRVTVTIPTATTFTVTGATSATVFNTAAVAVAANTTDKGNKSCPYFNAAAQYIKITPNTGPGNNSGRVRVTLHYIDITPATS